MAQGFDAAALLRNAQMLQRAGRDAEAAAAYVQLLARRPDLPDSWYNLAVLQRRTGRFEESLASYEQALRRNVSQPEEVHLNRGVIYSDCLRQPAAAERELNAALQINPDYLPALFNLANLNEDLGRRDEAAVIYLRMLGLDPLCHEALARYASLRAGATPNEPLIDRLRQAIAMPSTIAAQRASLGFALGKTLDACGRYEQAFDAYAKANAASREGVPAQAALYDRRRHEAFVDQMLAAFGRVEPIVPPGAGPRPIFICGMFRSGSTLTEQLLAGHSHVTPAGELAFLPSMVRGELAPFPASMAGVTAPQLQQIASRYLAMLSKLFPDADRVTDKRPDNFLYIGLIKRLFPDARIIHTTRNALDNCLSIYFLHLDHSMSYALDLLDTAHYYVQYRRLMSHWKSLYGADILDFDYDALVRDPRPAVEKLLAFCGLEWEESCLSFEQAPNAVRTASVWQVREPLYQRSSGRWRNYEAQLAPVRCHLRESGFADA